MKATLRKDAVSRELQNVVHFQQDLVSVVLVMYYSLVLT